MSKKSIVSYHYGQAGTQVGWEQWKLYCHEHGINWDGTRILPEQEEDEDNFQTFFYETASGKYVPKCVFMDTEPSVINALRESPLGYLVHDTCMINSRQGCRNVMPLAFLKDLDSSYNVQSRIPETVRRMREICDRTSGYMHYLSACGGAGPGLCVRTLEHMRKVDSKSIHHSHTILPSPTLSQNPMETYNSMLFLGSIRFDCLGMNVNTCYDNEALYRQSISLSRTRHNKFVPTYKHINELIAISVSSSTASIRWDGQLNVDLEDFQVNLVPYPNMHHVFHTNSPVLNNGNKDRLRVQDLTLDAFKNEAHCISLNCLSHCIKWEAEEEAGIFREPVWKDEAEDNDTVPPQCYGYTHGLIGCCLMYRGDVRPVKVNKAIRALMELKNPYFVSWVPNGFKVAINSPQLTLPSDWEYPGCRRSLVTMINSTAILEKFKQIVANYSSLRALNLYEQWFEHGIEETLMDAIKESLLESITAYETAMHRSNDSEDMKTAMETQVNLLPEFGDYITYKPDIDLPKPRR